MKTFEGTPAHRGYALGPAFFYRGVESIPAALHLRMPAILVAAYIDKRQLAMLDMSRFYGFVLDRGSIADPAYEPLAETHRPSLIGAHGVLEAAREGELVIVDAAAGRAIVDPDPPVRERYERLRGTRAPRLDPAEKEILDRFARAIREFKLLRRRPIPYDLRDERRLLALARKLAKGATPTPEDDAFLKDLMERD